MHKSIALRRFASLSGLVLGVFVTGCASITFTKDGVPIGRVRAPALANDIHVIFDPRSAEVVEARWTRNGGDLPWWCFWCREKIKIPRGANDWWFTTVWTGQPPEGPAVSPPLGANDWEIGWKNGEVVEAWWTRDGKRVQKIPLVPGAKGGRVVPPNPEGTPPPPIIEP